MPANKTTAEEDVVAAAGEDEDADKPADLHRRVGILLQYFDVDGNGLLREQEFVKMLQTVTLGQKFTKGLYGQACKAAQVKIRRGLDEKALAKLYATGFFDLGEHFAAFRKVRALPEDLEKLRELRACSDPHNVPCSIDQVAHLSDGSCVVVSAKTSQVPRTLYLFEDGTLTKLHHNLNVDGVQRGKFSPDKPSLLVFELEDQAFKVVEIDRSRRAVPALKVARSLGGFPPEWGDVDDEDEDDGTLWSACLYDGDLHVVALAQQKSKACFSLELETELRSDEATDDSSDSDEEGAIVHSWRRKWKFLVASHAGARIKLCEVPARASNVQISDDGQWCSYCVKLGEVQEEAERGEWYVCRLREGESPCKISQGPVGRIADVPARFSPSGTHVVYQANHTDSHPITMHMDLWLVTLQDGVWSPPTKLTPGSMQIDDFDWARGSDDLLWISGTAGADLCSFLLRVSTRHFEQIQPAAAFEALPSWNPFTGEAVYPIESISEFVGLWDESTSQTTRVPEWSQGFEDVIAEHVQWDGPGDTKVSGALYRSSNTSSSDRTLLVWVHGGPTCPWPILRRAGLNAEEFNFLALLRAGYLVLVPLYRGTLGFGDTWSMATCGCQGSLEGDLGDILAGVAHLQHAQIHGCSRRAGIFGESYGGYLAVRAMSDLEGLKVFQCGVSWYGYVSNRETTLLTGDFTWENEFCQQGPDVWPPPLRAEDSFNNLGNIVGPLLLCHGGDDPVCPVSHSQMVYRALHRRGVPTDLVIYPGFTHGFGSGKAGHDAHWRTLQWFLRHLPPSAGDPKVARTCDPERD